MEKILSKNYHRTNKTLKTVCIEKVLAVSLSISLIALSLFAIPANKVDATTTTYTNADTATVETSIKGLLQTGFDSMSDSVSFIIDGVEIAKMFLTTDGNGDIKKPFESKPIFTNLFEQKIMDMKSTNFNAYTRLAIKSYGISMQRSYSENGEGIINSIQVTVTYSFIWHDGTNALAGRTAVINHANAFLNSPVYTSQTTDYNKLKAINTYICNTFQYDYRLFVPAEATQVIYTAYKMITDTGAIGGYKRGVCQAYAMYAYIMLKQAGFGAITIDGTAPTSNPGPHAWNMVQIGGTGGNWYHIDFTWDDPVSGGNPAPYVTRQSGAGIVSENYLLRSNSELTINHSWNATQSGYTYPVASSPWGGTPTIINATQPPAPTVAPTAVPTTVVIPTPTKKPASSSTSTSTFTSSVVSSTQTSSTGANSSNESLQTASLTINPNSSSYSGQDHQPTTSSVDEEQNVTISGKLVDENGNPLANTKIELYNTSMTTTTDSEGNYTFNNVKIGNYKIYIKDASDAIIAELPIVISYGDKTELTSSSIQVKGSSLNLDLQLKGNLLSIRSVSSPKFQITNEMLILGLIVMALIAMILLSSVIRRKRSKNSNW